MKPHDPEFKCPICECESIMKVSATPFTTNGVCRECFHKANIDQFAVEDEQERADQIANYYDYQ